MNVKELGILDTMPAIIFYHKADIDGKMSALVCMKYFRECEIIGIDRPDETFADAIRLLEDSGHDYGKDKVLVMIDYSLKKPEDFDALSKIFGHSVLIDHHKTTINDYNEYLAIKNPKKVNFHTVFEIGIGACEIGYKFFFPDAYMSPSVVLASKYDVFDQTDMLFWNARVLPFQYGIRTEIDERLAKVKIDILKNNPYLADLIIEKGATILKYIEQENKIAIKSAFRRKMRFGDRDYNFLVLSTPGNSIVFDSVKNEEDEVLCRYIFNGSTYKYTLYQANKEIDVSVIAKMNGGGGHAGAAGFISSEFIF